MRGKSISVIRLELWNTLTPSRWTCEATPSRITRNIDNEIIQDYTNRGDASGHNKIIRRGCESASDQSGIELHGQGETLKSQWALQLRRLFYSSSAQCGESIQLCAFFVVFSSIDFCSCLWVRPSIPVLYARSSLSKALSGPSHLYGVWNGYTEVMQNTYYQRLLDLIYCCSQQLYYYIIVLECCLNSLAKWQFSLSFDRLWPQHRLAASK